MSDYIKREDVIEVFEKCSMEDDKLFLVIVRALVNSIPAADVAEVKHGKWIAEYERQGNYSHCSLCDCRCAGYTPNYKFCPNCGAKMDLED